MTEVREYATENVRNVVFLGHSGSGKSTLAEAMLFSQKKIERMGRTEDGNLTSDYDAEEAKRRMSINASVLPIDTKTVKVNILDCPGSRDFIGEIRSAVRVAEGALVLIDATAGVEVGTEHAMECAEECGLPVAVFVNKLDKENADFAKVCDSITETFHRKAVPLVLPIGAQANLRGVVDVVRMKAVEEKDGKSQIGDVPTDLQAEAESVREQIIEAAAEGDDALMERFFEEGTLSDEEVARGLKAAFIDKRFIPVLCGAAIGGIGASTALDFLEHSFPNPLEMPGLALEGDEHKVQKVKPEDPFSAFVFKTVSDDFAGRLTFFKVMTGTMSSSTSIYNHTQSKAEKVAHVLVPRGKKQEEVAHVCAGDVGVVAKLAVTGTNDTLADPKSPIRFAPTIYPQQTTRIAIQAKSSQDEDKIGMGLHALVEQDRTLRFDRDGEVRQTLLSGMGEQHLDVSVSRLRAKSRVEVELREPKIRYRETITRKAEGQYRHKKQTGGRGQFAEVFVRLSPTEDGSDFQFKWSVFGGAVPTNFRGAVEKGAVMAMERGVLAAYRTVGVCFDCYDGKHHPVDSSDMAFQIASSMAFRQTALQAGPILLEPICIVTTTVPEQYMGDVMGDISQRRGRIQGTESRGNKAVVKALVPEAELQTYGPNLRSMTGGRCVFEKSFSHHEPVPHELQQKIIEAAAKEKEEES
jgi:elongation factor G